MGIVQKRADELKPGDVVKLGVHGKCSFLYAKSDPIVDVVRAQFGAHSGKGLVMLDVNPQHDTVFQVELPELTIAQQHAEELAEGLRKSIRMLERSDYPEGAEVDSMRALLDKIKPPEPPTLEEALTLLEAVRDEFGCGQEYGSKMDALVERGRLAGVLK